MKNDSHTTPEKAKVTRKEYEGELHKLQVELCKLQDWVNTRGYVSLLSLRVATRREKAARSRQSLSA